MMKIHTIYNNIKLSPHYCVTYAAKMLLKRAYILTGVIVIDKKRPASEQCLEFTLTFYKCCVMELNE